MISLKTIGIFLSLPVKLLWVVIKYPFVGGINNKFKNDLINSLKLTIFRLALGFPTEDKGKLSITTNEYLINSIIAKQYPNLTELLNNYGKNYDDNSIWIVEAENRLKQDPILIYLHGGCFVFESAPSQIEGLLTFYNLIDEEYRKKLSILFLDYKLASKGYNVPYQLNQLIETYTKLVNEGNNNFITLGDSAGGTLILTLLQKLKHDETLKSFPFPKSSIMLSPWCKLVPDNEDYYLPNHSMHDNSTFDMMQIHHYQQMFSVQGIKQMFGNNDIKSLTISPGNCTYSISDWEKIPTFNDPGYSTLVILGEDETMRDDILQWCKYALGSTLTPQRESSNGVWISDIHEYIRDDKQLSYVDVVVEPFGIHDGFFMFESGLLGDINKGKPVNVNELDKIKYFGTVKIVEFLNKVLLNSETKKTV